MSGQPKTPSATIIDLTLNGVTNASMLAQLPAALIHESFFGIYQIAPWTVIELEHGACRITAWLVPASRDILNRSVDQSWCSTLWISKDLARELGVAFDTPTKLRLYGRSRSVRVQPARIDNYIESDRVVADPELVKTFGRQVLVTSGSRIAVLRTVSRHSRRQSPKSIRMNYHMRRLLGISPDPVTNRQIVQVSQYFPVSPPLSRREQLAGALMWALKLPLWITELLARAALRAPSVLLACEESYTSDDPHGVARLPEEAAELLGIDSGDSVFVYWGKRQLKIRALTFKEDHKPSVQNQRIIDWTPLLRPPKADHESRIALPGKVRARLGAPRNAIVRVRRSVLSVLRRRLISLSLPVAAVGVSTAALSIPWFLGAVLVATVFFLTLAGDRIPRKPWIH